jgi:uncharacterized Zn-finger protein
MTIENRIKNSYNNMSTKLNELKTINESKKRPLKNLKGLSIHSKKLHVSSNRNLKSFWRKQRDVKGEKKFSHAKNVLRKPNSGGAQKVFECLECGKQLTTSYGHKTHLRLHTGEKPYACHLCEKKYSQHNGLRQHLRAHSNERPFVCAKCGKKFSQPSNLKHHSRIHSGEK